LTIQLRTGSGTVCCAYDAACTVTLGTVSESDDFHAVVSAAGRGEAWALATLYRSHQSALLLFLFGLVGREAEDLASETWIDVARVLDRFQDDEVGFRRLLYTVARRRAIDHGRKARRRRTDPAAMDAGQEPAREGDFAEQMAELDSSRRAIAHIRALLPPEQAEVVLLRVVAGLSVQEVSAVIGRSPAAISVIQTRALQRLAVKLGDPSRWARLSEPR
jgi:RNA polymerase sigma-70 factor (ECF subfamily)